MAYSFGGGINPQLGATDYSAVLRGAQNYAQSTAAGSAAIGQGIGSALASLGQGMQQYQQNQERSRMMLGELQNVIQNDPSALKSVDPKVIKQVESGDIRFKDLQQTYANVMTGQKMKAARQASDDQRKIAIGMSALSYGKTKNPLQAIRGSGEELTPGVVNFFAQLENLQSETAKNVAASQPKGMEGVPVGLKEVLALREQGLDVDAVPIGGGQYVMRKVGTFAPPQQTTVNLPAAETSRGRKLGELAAEQQMTEFKAANDAVQNITKIDETLSLLESGDPTTGLGAELLNNINRVRVFFGDKEKTGKKVSDTEILDAMLGSDVFPMIGALGIGARGLDTPAERDFLRSVMTGKIEMNKDSLKRLTKIRRDIQLRAINKFNDKVAGGELDSFFKETGFPKKPVAIPTMGGETSAPRVRRYNPATGKLE